MNKYSEMPEFPQVGPPVTFSPSTETGLKVRCDVCGREGWGPTTQDVDDAGPGAVIQWMPWQLLCGNRGHLPCPDCGAMLGAKLDGSARRHTRCPQA